MEYLYLNGNQISSLPSDIGNLKLLRTLRINNNSLTSIPAEIGILNNLEELLLGNNKLTTIPSEIGNIKILHYLYLNNNNLINIPQEIARCRQMNYLDISHNQLSTLPDSMVTMYLDNELDCGYNKLDTLNLSDTLISWLDKSDPDWRETQNITNIIHTGTKKQMPSITYLYPNSIIQLYLPSSQNIKLQIYDLKGRTVATLINGCRNAGIHRLRWDKNKYARGMYLLRLQLDKSSLVKKLLLFK